MKFLVTAILFLATTIVAFSQTTTFYKDEYLNIEVKEKKGKFKKVETQLENGLISVKKYAVKGNVLLKESYYRYGKPTGTWLAYNADGSVRSKRNFDALVYSKDKPENVFDNIIPDSSSDQYKQAIFQNGSGDLSNFLVKEVRYPAESLTRGASGTVYIRFIVDETGKARPHSIVEGVDPFIDYETWSLIERMPVWNPAQLNGKPIESFFTMPFKFALK